VANSEHLAKLDEGVEAWNNWRVNHAFLPDLRGAALSGRDLSTANLRGADLRGAGFEASSLFRASLREANLQGIDLSVAKRGLQTEQLAGADLTGATLPEELKKLYDGLQNVNNISESARKLFLAVLAACLYSWLTIATTTDVNLITNRASSPLPNHPNQYSHCWVLLGRAAVVALCLLLLPLLSAEALGGTRFSAGHPSRWTAPARQNRPLAAQ